MAHRKRSHIYSEIRSRDNFGTGRSTRCSCNSHYTEFPPRPLGKESIAEMSKAINPYYTCIRATSVGRQQVLGDVVLSSGLAKSPLYRNRKEAPASGFDLRKVCMWGWALADRGQGERGKARVSRNAALHHVTLISSRSISNYSENSMPMCFHQKSGIPAHTRFLPTAQGDNKSHFMEYCEN